MSKTEQMNKSDRENFEQDIEKEVYCGILPVKREERTCNFMDAFLILSGYCIATWSYTQGAYLTGLVNFKQLLITSIAGALLMLLIYQLPVILSTRYGIDIWIWLRAIFGVKGVKIISVILIIVNFPWYAVCCELFASSMINLFALYGLNLQGPWFLILKLLCVGIGTLLAWKGVKTISRTTKILVPMLLVVGAIVIYVAFSAVPFSAIWNYEPVSIAMPHSTAYILALEANFAFVITLVGGMAGVPRLCKSEKGAYYAGVLGQGISGSFFVVVGAVMVIAMQYVTGKPSTDPTEMLSTLASPILALSSLLLVAFANVGTQAVGSYLYGVTLKSTFSKAKYHTLISILGVYVAILCVWGKIIDYFGSFLTISACIYAPIAALLWVDFFLVRKQRLDFKGAFELEGKNTYRYTNGYNVIGIICLIIGCVMSLLVYNPISGEIYNNALFVLTPTGCALIGTGILYYLLYCIPCVRRYIRKDTYINPIKEPFDRNRVPPRQNIIILPFLWIFCLIMTIPARLKIKKINMKGIKPPYLVLGTHHSFTDFYVTPLALFPYRANYVSELEGFEYYGEWLYRQIGCLGTRKFIGDRQLIKNIKVVLDRGDNLVLYPEARYANVGTSSKLKMSVAKMVKKYGYPVVVLNMKGNYLQSPIWNLTRRKEARLYTEMIGALTKEDIDKLSAEEIYDRLSDLLKYDEYKWQREQKIKITYPKRAEGLHKPLYQCYHCACEDEMTSEDTKLICKKCNTVWEMDEYGVLHEEGSKDSCIHIPEWYEWQRNNVSEQIKNEEYEFSMKVQVDALPNAKNFVDCGIGELKHTNEGFNLEFYDYRVGERVEKFFRSKSMSSIHTEYDYRGKGECVTLSTLDDTYFLFPWSEDDEIKKFHATKIQFAVEKLYEL